MERGNKDSQEDKTENKERSALIANGAWDDDMECRWRQMKTAKANFLASYDESQNLLEATETNDRYYQAMSAFRKKRNKKGLCEYGDEFDDAFADLWFNKTQKKLAKELDEKINEIKKKYGMDFDTLNNLLRQQEATQGDSKKPWDVTNYFDGHDVLQLLTLMVELEGKLARLEGRSSSFAAKVKDYYDKVDKLGLKKRNEANVLLKEKEFVSLLVALHACYMKMICENVLTKDIMKLLNQSVYWIGYMKESSQLEKYFPKVESSSAGSPFSYTPANVKRFSKEPDTSGRGWGRDRRNGANLMSPQSDLEPSLNHGRGRGRGINPAYTGNPTGETDDGTFNLPSFGLLGMDSNGVPLQGTAEPIYLRRTVASSSAGSPFLYPPANVKRLSKGPGTIGRGWGRDRRNGANLMSPLSDLEPSLNHGRGRGRGINPAYTGNPSEETDAGTFNGSSFGQLGIYPNGVPLQATAEPIYNWRTGNVASSSAGSSSYYPANYMQTSGLPGTSGRGWGSDEGNAANLMPFQNSGWGPGGSIGANSMPFQNSGWGPGGSIGANWGHMSPQSNFAPSLNHGWGQGINPFHTY